MLFGEGEGERLTSVDVVMFDFLGMGILFERGEMMDEEEEEEEEEDEQLL
jgi:hypothetical protein